MVKSKVRFDGLDVAAMVAHWNRVALGRRVINIYNGSNGDTYLIKLDKQTGEAGNMLLLLESGIRFHSTNESYENPGMPSPFCAKLRKHLRGLRLESVQQLGKKDRVVLLTFGSGEAQRHALILEFYARGNIVLTNSSYSILSLLRSHDYDGQIKVQVGHTYPVTYATTMGSPDEESSNDSTLLLTTPNPLEWYKAHWIPSEDPTKNPNTGKKKKGAAEANSEWRTLFLRAESGVAHYTPNLLEHCLLCADIDPKKQPPSALKDDDWKRLQIILQKEAERIFTETEVVDGKGYILYQPKPTSNDQPNEEQNPATSPYGDKLFLEFQPYLLRQHQDMLRLEFDNFNHAVDAFFAHIESQKRVLRAETQQAQAEQRLDKIKKDQEQRVEQLRQQQDILKLQAQLVETHADMVDKAIQVVNSALDTGMDWDQLEDLVRVEQTQNRNPVALLIDRLDLEHDALVLRLEKMDFMIEDDDAANDEDPSASKFMNVTVDLNDTAFGNASTMFAKYRASKDKSQKTMEASTKALEAAEESARRQVLEAQKRKTHLAGSLQIKRKPLWFEKFNWFITSDNYLVIAGRDAQQNEVIVKRYLRPGDAYLHADVHGAASCILRAKRRRTTADGKTQTLPLSEQALREAGSFTICQSSAWKSKMVTSAWWVEAHQVSKTAPTGEYLTVGSFMVRGKKNYLPPTQLEMGFGVLFRLGDDEGVARHKNERRDFALMQLEEQEEESVLDTDPAQDSPHEPPDLAPVEAEVEESPPDEQLQLKDETTAPATEDLNQDSPEEEDTAEVPTTEEAMSVTSADKATTKKGLSIKQRRLIKKYGSLEAAQAAEEERLKAEQENQSKSKGSNGSGKNGTDVPKRGKKTKLQKIAKKYAEQDDEDRELALLALHAGERDKKKEKKTGPDLSETAKTIAAQTIQILNKDPGEIAAQLPADVKDILAKAVSVPVSTDSNEPPEIRWGKFDADVLEQVLTLESEEQQVAAAKRLLTLKETTRIDNFSASLAGIIRTIRKYGHEGLQTANTGNSAETAAAKRKTKVEKENEQESWKRTLAEEGVVDEELDDDAVDDTVELGKLTGKPHPDDLILFAVPVCAPYPTLSQYTYRVKLTPGNMKRGKAVKACVEIFLKDDQKSPQSTRLKELIKKVAETEWVHAVIGDVKIAAAGAQKQIQKSKNKPKKK